MRRRRVLREDEAAMWAHVARGVTPLPGRLVPMLTQREPPASAPPPSAAAGATRPVVPVALAPAALPPVAVLERRTRMALRRGVIPIEAVLDLHGLRQAEAHDALRRFLVRAQRQGAKLALVITGKGIPGDPSPEGRGVLRRLVPHWLRMADLRHTVVAVEEAGARHGGSGALYVRLRRARSSEDFGA